MLRGALELWSILNDRHAVNFFMRKNLQACIKNKNPRLLVLVETTIKKFRCYLYSSLKNNLPFFRS